MDNLLLAKLWYLAYFGGLVCASPFVNLLYRANGLQDAQIGVLAALKPWVSAPASFAWSALADRFRIHRPLLLATFVSSTLIRSSTALVHSYPAFIALAVVGELLAAPVGVMADAAVVAACKQDTDYGKARLWGAVAWGGLSTLSGWVVARFGMTTAFAASVIVSAPCVVVATRMRFDLGQPRQQQEGKSSSGSSIELQAQQGPDNDEERQQLLHAPAPAPQHQDTAGQLTAGAGAGGVGGSCNQGTRVQGAADGNSRSAEGSSSDLVQDDDVRVLLVDSTPQQLQAGSSAGTTQKQQPQHCQQQGAGAACSSSQPPHFWASLVQLVWRPEVLIFFGQATVMGAGLGVIGEYLILYLQELGGSPTLYGLTLTVTCLAEVPMFQFQSAVLQHMSTHTMLQIVMGAYVLRLGLYALLPFAGTPWAVLPIELLHGICFACGWGAGTITCKRMAPPELAATMQGIFQGLYFGVGQGFGAIVGGALKQRYGGQAMFLMASCAVAACWAALFAAELATQRWAAAQRAVADQDQPWLLEQGVPPASPDARSWLQRLWWVVCSAPAAPAAGVPSGRHWKQAALRSKDSGPDLAAVAMAGASSRLDG